jgi:glycosyltransferase involved in cell wall biosynthesis
VSHTSRKINVLLANDHLGWGKQTHGVARLFELWASHLDPERFKITVCILRDQRGLGEMLTGKGIEVIFVGKGKFDPTTLLSFLRIVRERRIDLMHLQAYGASTFGRIAGRLTGVPTIVHFHDTTPYYPWVQKLADRLLRESADAYVAISRTVRDWWAKRLALDPARVLVMPNAIDLQAFVPPSPCEIDEGRRLLGLPPGARVVGTVTRLFEEKGTRYLIEAVPRVLAVVPEAVFVIVGDGPLRADLEAAALALGVRERVVFAGYCADVASLLGVFEVFALTSCFAEGGCPLPVVEALAMGKPVVVTDVVEIVTHDVDGRVIPARDPQRLAEEISALLLHRDQAQRLAAAGRRLAERHDIQSYVRQLGQLYEALVDASAGG